LVVYIIYISLYFSETC